MDPDFPRAFRFQRWVQERTSTRTVPMPWGTAYFHDAFPLRYDSNMAIADRPFGGIDADGVVAVLDDVYSGFAHREIEVESATEADRIAMGMGEHGYAIERLLVMAHRGAPDRAPDLGAVGEIDAATLRPYRVETNAREPWGTDPAVAGMLADFPAVLEQRIRARFFAQAIDGEIGGACELYLDGDVAQVENVDTLEEFRGRGIARNVVLRAVDEARTAGARLVFLFADADDWPRHLYARLGFETIGESRLFTRFPEHMSSAG